MGHMEGMEKEAKEKFAQFFEAKVEGELPHKIENAVNAQIS